MTDYRRGCRCLRCRAARGVYRRSLGTNRRPVDEAHKIIRRLITAGMGLRQISAVAGVGFGTILRIWYRQQPTVQRSVVERLTRTITERAPGDLVSSWRSQRLIDALLAEGFNPAKLRGLIRCPLKLGPRVKIRTERRLELIHQRLTE